MSTIPRSAKIGDRIVGKRRTRLLKSWYDFVEDEKTELGIEENLENAGRRGVSVWTKEERLIRIGHRPAMKKRKGCLTTASRKQTFIENIYPIAGGSPRS